MKILMIIALVLLTLIAIAFGFIYWQNSQVPALSHVNGQLAPLSGNPNGVSTQTDNPATAVDTWAFKADRVATMQAIKDAVAAYGEAEILREEEHYLRVVFITPKMRFRDDAEIYLDSESREVHFRSESRAGKSDLGLNRLRHEKLTELYGR